MKKQKQVSKNELRNQLWQLDEQMEDLCCELQGKLNDTSLLVKQIDALREHQGMLRVSLHKR